MQRGVPDGTVSVAESDNPSVVGIVTARSSARHAWAITSSAIPIAITHRLPGE
jgi:hypothetical protein